MNQSSFCKNCGARMHPDSRFCESCGAPVTETPGDVPAAPAGCPKCMQADRTTTAAAFVNEDLSSLSQEEGEAQEAAQMCLSAPDPPALPSRVLWAVIPFVPVVNALLIWFAPMHKYYKLVMLAIGAVFVACVAVPGWYENDAYIIPGLVLVIVYYCGLIFDRKRQKVELERRLKPEYERKAADWQILAYCKRCRIAWLAGRPARFVPVEEADELLGSEPAISQEAR